MNIDANSLGEMLDLDAAAALDASYIQISLLVTVKKKKKKKKKKI